MKKVKIMLTAVTVLAVVGGALAFKVKTPHQFYSINPANNVCELPYQPLLTTTVDQDPENFNATITTQFRGACGAYVTNAD